MNAPVSPEMQRFIEKVIVPALLERLIREREPQRPQAA
jgi:hypothetical protein